MCIDQTQEQPTSIAEAVRRHEWDKARYLTAIRVAEALDGTQSARDTKALSLSLLPLIDRVEATQIGQSTDTPLARILAEAELLASNSQQA